MTRTARPRFTSSRSTREALSILSSVLIVTGSLLILDAVLTIVWQEPLSALYAKFQQDKLKDQFQTLERQQPSPSEKQALTKLTDSQRRIAFLARLLDRHAKNGSAIGRITIKKIHLSKIVVQGTGTDDLRKGPGHYPETPMPGVHGTVAIAGHRTTYGAPFHDINKLKPHDKIDVKMPYGMFHYEVERTRIVPPTATWVIKPVSYDRLVLSACHPLYSAAKRIVVFARLVDIEPLGPALAPGRTRQHLIPQSSGQPLRQTFPPSST